MHVTFFTGKVFKAVRVSDLSIHQQSVLQRLATDKTFASSWKDGKIPEVLALFGFDTSHACHSAEELDEWLHPDAVEATPQLWYASPSRFSHSPSLSPSLLHFSLICFT